MKKLISVLIVLIMISIPVMANALTDKEKQEIEAIKKNNEKIMQQMEEMKKQAEKAKLENQKQLEELQKKSAAKSAATQPVVAKTEKFDPKAYSKYIPNKDNQKIFWMPKKVMNDNELGKYLKETHSKVEHAISKQAKKDAEQVIKEIKNKYKTDTNIAIANAANASWMIQRQEEALYIMGVACNNDPNPDNLNNYAVFLTMGGAPEKAIPILNKLNSQYPDNSTVLNNLGQAWFDLGDTQQAEKYLDASIKAFAYHSQANYTKSIIEAAKGNQAQAIAAMKRSIKRGYSEKKENILTKLGGKLDESDLNFPMPQDPLGLEKFVLPPYPQSASDVGASRKWEEFQQQCSQKYDELYAQEMALRKEMDAQHNTDMQTYEQYKLNPLKNQGLIKKMMKWPPLYRKAMAKLRIEGDEVAGWDESDYKKYKEKEAENEKFKAEIEALKKQWAEGEQSCAKDTKYIKLINTKYEARNTEYIEKLRKKTNTRAYYLQYATPGGDTAVELMKVLQKEQFLSELRALPVELYTGGSCGGQAEYQKSGGKLADFYDLHCDQHITVGVPGFMYSEFSCNKEKTTIDIPGLSANWKENLDTGDFKGSAELGVDMGRSLTLGKYGPLKAELGIKMKTSGFIEFDNTGITDFGATVSSGIKAGAGVSTDVMGKDILYGGDDINYGKVGKSESSTLVGAEARFGWNSGMTTTGKGVLAGKI